jgi:eukaryotic-like serine/threonine-protein kinase
MSGTGPEIAGFHFQGLIESGGYSSVFRYTQERPDRDVAVKVLTGTGLGAAVLARMDKEANAMASLAQHPHVVEVIATGFADGRYYIVMPYCPGPNLAQLVATGTLDVRKVVRLGIQIAGAVEAAHRAGIIHRDIKPANILTDRYESPRLTDFGIAGRVTPSAAAEDEEVGLSLPWCPPEILQGDPGSVASDVYALGATLWHLLAGRPVFAVDGANSRADMEARTRHQAAAGTGRPGVPAELERLLARTLAKQPGRRPGSAKEVQDGLRDIEARLGGEVAADVPWHVGAPRQRPAERDRDLEGTRAAGADLTALDGIRERYESGRPWPAPARLAPPLRRPDSPARPVGLPEPAPNLTVRRTPDPVPEPATPAVDAGHSRLGRWIWVAAIAVLAVAGTGTAVLVGGSSTSAGPTGPSTVDNGDAVPQDAGALGDNAPPGVPVVTASRPDPATLRFSWTYSAPLASDTFSWRTPDGARSGTARTGTVDVADPAGTELCLQVKVIRADGSYATVDWSPKGCGT